NERRRACRAKRARTRARTRAIGLPGRTRIPGPPVAEKEAASVVGAQPTRSMVRRTSPARSGATIRREVAASHPEHAPATRSPRGGAKTRSAVRLRRLERLLRVARRAARRGRLARDVPLENHERIRARLRRLD